MMVGTPAMQLAVRLGLYTPNKLSAGLLMLFAICGSTATGISNSVGLTTLILYWFSLNVLVYLFFSSYKPGTEKLSK